MRVRGGLIGSNPSVSQTVASNIWHIRDAESYSRSGTWPSIAGMPTNVSATATNSQIALTWTAPASNGGSAITDYVVQYSSNSGSSWTTFSRSVSAATSATVTGLTNGTAYVLRVAAVTAYGTGAYTAASSSVTPASASVPGAPTNFINNSAGSCGDIYLSWTAPNDGGSAITAYRIRYNENSYATYYSFSPSGGTASRAINLSALIADGYRTVTIRLSAVNAIGEGSFAAVTINPAQDIYSRCG